jgi:hypothetical protein
MLSRQRILSRYSRLFDSAVAYANRQQGIVFFLAHPFLYPLLKARLLPAVLLSLFVLINLFVWTLLPQVLFLKIFHTAGSAWVNAVFLVLGEGAAIVALLFESFLVVRIHALLAIHIY